MASILVKLDSFSIRFLSAFVVFLRFSSSWKSNVLFGKHFYAYVLVHTNQTVTYWTKLFFKKRFLRRVTLFWNIALIVYHRRSQDFWLGAAKTTNHIGEQQEKKSSQSDLRVLIGNFVGDQFRIGGRGRTRNNLYSEVQNKKQEQVSRSEELNFFRKKVKSKKKR